MGQLKRHSWQTETELVRRWSAPDFGVEVVPTILCRAEIRPRRRAAQKAPDLESDRQGPARSPISLEAAPAGNGANGGNSIGRADDLILTESSGWGCRLRQAGGIIVFIELHCPPISQAPDIDFRRFERLASGVNAPSGRPNHHNQSLSDEVGSEVKHRPPTDQAGEVALELLLHS